ncbi:hypothetical protein SLEP1_g32822 [Rubroshorea leprosula]|uniref:Glycoside hydrolase family 5 domain-containing protein n=1 Tax=Rubroshorea leprosula TaxID=152421 RepID=A0AAV5KEL4_9ROSI|nr:hypothetical protein SLEP1_g32822 [Rubroshorea leprosula]
MGRFSSTTPLCILLRLLLLLLLLLFLTRHTIPVNSLPLSTNSRWIVDDQTGQRVKLACVNWVSHLEPIVAEGLAQGLSKQPLDSFKSLGLQESIAGIQSNNPSTIDVSLIHAYQAVVSSLGNNNIMVILDNHISKPGWCCSNFDGNGFFGDQYFNPDIWTRDLTRIAILFNGVPNVVGMSLKNELRGPKQNVNDWYKYMQGGAETVHSANPNVLSDPLRLEWRGVGNRETNQVCGNVVKRVMGSTELLLQQGYPPFLSEFGLDQRGTNVNDNRYLTCFMGVAAELDFDWAYWTLELRSPAENICSKISSPRRGLAECKPHLVIFHPATGLCLQRKSLFEPLRLGACSESEAWSYKTQKSLVIKGDLFLPTS